ncbi:MAG TPA: S41 family peptidase [Candidatus Paceibacterota bacterium]|nr:S41 family peptidase [Candidatus Paceibacterota bacterium]
MASADNDRIPQDRPSRASWPRRARLLLVGSVIIALAAGLYGGYRYGLSQAFPDRIVTQVVNKDQTGTSPAVDFSLFWQVWDRLHSSYVDAGNLDSTKLVYGAIDGMVNAAGDPYTEFFPPSDATSFNEEISGAFSGVGMEIGMRNGAITVIAPIKDTPAMRAGIKAGDTILKIDGQAVDGWSVDEAVDHIRGKQGTTVHLTLLRDGQNTPLEFTIVRDVIKVPAVDWKLIDGHIAYLQIYEFNGNVDDEFAQAAQQIVDSHADRLIIDLRNNPGGLLDSAVNIAGWLMQPGSVVVQEKASDGTITELHASGNAKLASVPTIILVDGGSASASEILAGAMHDIRNVRLVGAKTFGKGSVQQLEDFYNGSALKVTVAKWLTPNGVSISEVGIAPTDPVKMDPTDPAASTWEYGTPGKDPQLDKALELIK